MKSGADTLPYDPVLLKQMLLLAQGKVTQLQEQNALLLQRLFGRKSEQTVDPDSPQLPLLNEAEALLDVAPEASAEEVDEEVVAPLKRRGKRKPLPANLPRVEVVHELPEHELRCTCGDAQPPRCRHPSPDPGALGDPVRRTAANIAQPDARQTV